MERLATQKLIEWNKSTNRKPLIVWGARQVGKTYLVKDILPTSIIKIVISTLTARKKMKFVNFAFLPQTQKRLLSSYLSKRQANRQQNLIDF